jgi:hypothetical protein
VETFVILFVAAGLGASVVWWASTPRSPRPHRTQPRPVHFRDTFTTVPDPPPAREGDDGWVVLPSAASDDRPSPIVALVRIVLTIAFVAALGVGAIAGLWLLIRSQLGG